jgi:hypothetical protein
LNATAGETELCWNLQRHIPTISQLPEAARRQIDGWLAEKTYREVTLLIAEHFGVSLKKSALSAYWQRLRPNERRLGGPPAPATLAAGELAQRVSFARLSNGVYEFTIFDPAPESVRFEVKVQRA